MTSPLLRNVHAYRDMWDSERDVGEDGEPAKAVKSCASMREVCRERTNYHLSKV